MNNYVYCSNTLYYIATCCCSVKIANQSIKLSCYTVVWLPEFLLLMASAHLNCFLHLCLVIVESLISVRTHACIMLRKVSQSLSVSYSIS